MAVPLGKDVVELLQDDDTVKVLVTLDKEGAPHAVVKKSIELGQDGNLLHLELIESSQTNKNLARAIWHQGKVSLSLIGKGDLSYQIKGRPIKSIVAGPIFQEHYVKVRERLGDVDLAAVWVIEPDEVINESFSVRLAEEQARHPLHTHLDRIARRSS